jgi:hypothetical protein
MDISGVAAEVHMRTDANNLVSTAKTTHLPEQKETIHMIQMMRAEASSGGIDDLSHVRTEHCLSDALTKSSAKPDQLLKAVATGLLPEVDTHPPFRSMLKHKAFLTTWIASNVKDAREVVYFLGEYVFHDLQSFYCEKVRHYPLDHNCFDNTDRHPKTDLESVCLTACVERNTSGCSPAVWD